MRYIDEAQTQIEASAEEGAALGAPNGGFFSLPLFIERGGNLDDVEPYHKWQNSAAIGRAAVSAAIYAKCEALITQGLVSSALGAPHTYPSKVIDQQNLAANVQRSTLPANASNPAWITWHMCADASGAWMFRPHTAAQIQQVGEDLADAITLIRMANATKIAELEGLTVAQLEAYTIDEGWPT